MNSFIKTKRISSSIGFKVPPLPNINIKLKYKKNSLSKIIEDIKFIRYKKLNKDSIINRNYFYKPKTSLRNNRYFKDVGGIDFNDNETIFPKEINKIKINQIKRPIWNYSYYFNQNNNKVLKHNYSAKKIRIKELLNLKDPNIIEDWQKPRMIKILEKNSLIEEEIMLRPWKFFPNLDK